jgi:two-component system response regulator HydG
MKQIAILLDDNELGGIFSQFLTNHHYETIQFPSLDDCLNHPSLNDCILLTQCTWQDMHGAQLVSFLKEKTNAPIILVTKKSDNLTQAVASIKAGAEDYLLLPVLPEELLRAIREVEKKLEAGPTPQTTREEEFKQKRPTGQTISDHPSLKTAMEQLARVARTNYSVIIYGESGTGKEKMASMIHQQSDRAKAPFVALDCGALNEELANSELFGHEKGSFTGATHTKIGAFEQANNGTLFLDEVANLPYSIQVSLLRVLQERSIKRVGSTLEIPVDVRIIVACNENLWTKCKQGQFREDLFHRLNEFQFELPPLRERRQDLAGFIQLFIDQTNEELGKNIEGVSDAAMEVLRHYSWPGNLRELRNVIRQACLQAVKTIQLRNLPNHLLMATNLRESDNGRPFRSEGTHPPIDRLSENNMFGRTSLKNILLQKEYELIKRTLDENNQNKSKVARLLKIDRKTLYNKLASYSLIVKQNQRKN